MIITVFVFLVLIFTISILGVVSRQQGPPKSSSTSPGKAAYGAHSSSSRSHPVYIDGRRSLGWDAYFAKRPYCYPDALKTNSPAHYEWDDLPGMLSKRLSEYVAPSYGVVDTHEEHEVSRLVHDVYTRAQSHERSKDYAIALDYYLLILFSVVPLGDSYYLRPAILLERFKQYQAAILVCRMRYRYIRADLQGSSEENKKLAIAEWKKREARLKKKQSTQSALNT